MKSVDAMSPEELFLEAGKVREQIVMSAEKLHRICDLMYAQARRNSDDLTSAFVGISNAGRRFAGSVVTGAKRTSALDRILDTAKTNAKRDRELAARRKLEAAKRLEARELKQASFAQRVDFYSLFTSSNEDDLIERMISQGDAKSDLNELYGEE